MPVDLRGKDWAAQISAACAATYMFLSGGTSLSIRRALPSVLVTTHARLKSSPMLQQMAGVWVHLGLLVFCTAAPIDPVCYLCRG